MRTASILSLALGAIVGVSLIFFTILTIPTLENVVGSTDWMIIPGLLLFALVINHLLVGSRFNGIRLAVGKDEELQYKGNRVDSDSNDIKNLSRYYSTLELSKLEESLKLRKTKWIIYVLGALSTFVLLTLALWIANLGRKDYLEILLVLSGVLIGAFLFGSYFGIPILLQFNKLEPETEGLIKTEEGEVRIFYLLFILAAVVLYISGSLRGWLAELTAFVFLLVAFPMYFINRLEGKYFFLFGLHQYFRAGNWDFLEGNFVKKHTPGFTVSNKYQIKALMTRIGALIGVIGIVLGLVGSVLGLVDGITTAITGIEPFNEDSFLLNFAKTFPGPITLYLLFLGLGSLITLLTAPMGYIETWANQGLYDAISLASSKDEIIQTFAKKKSVRYPSLTKDFGYNLLVVSSMMLSLITLTAISSVLSVEYTSVGQGIWLAQRAGGVVFLANIIVNLRNLNEERTIYMLAKQAKQATESANSR